MTQNQQRTDTTPPTATEREIIETAAAAAPVENSTTTQKAMNIMEASVIQRKAVAEAFEAQKKAITGAVEEQRALAMQQMATTQKKYAVTEAHKKQLAAQEATKNLGVLTREALGERPSQSKQDNSPDPEQVAADDENPQGATKEEVPALAPTAGEESVQQPHHQSLPQQQAAPAAPAPAAAQMQSTPQTPAQPAAEPAMNTSVADELALTIRSIISEEIDKQLKTLLAVVTTSNNAETPDT